MRETLTTALDLIFGHEGGYVNNPKDPGGATKYGITHRTLAAHRGVASVTPAQVRALSKEEAIEIYRRSYWVQSGGDLLPVGIDFMAFDYGVNSGPAQAVKSLQRVVGVTADGIVGGQTVAAVNTYKGDLVDAYAAERLRFMRALKTWPVFGRGWQKRVSAVVSQARHIIRGMQPTTDAPIHSAKNQPQRSVNYGNTEKTRGMGIYWWSFIRSWWHGFRHRSHAVGACNHHGRSIRHRCIFPHQAHAGSSGMKISLQHITGAVIGGAVSGLFFYALGTHDGKQQAALKVAQAVTQAIQNRAGINETIDNLDSVALCVELGGMRDQCQQLRGMAEDQP